ncbi:unnamed protein product [Rodentolepis nana]|uniref:Homeobox_KN domain-containing protein n=1 Tax=Rodentolepis nana TaxID=102285 RepID=A0A0R3T8R5_RODNA|nr:unnamed protein product [Rodentolepis nana]
MHMERNYTEDDSFGRFIHEDIYPEPDDCPRFQQTSPPRTESSRTYAAINRMDSLNPPISNQVYLHSSSWNYISEHSAPINTASQHNYSLSQSHSGIDKWDTISYERMDSQNPLAHRVETEGSGSSQKINARCALTSSLPSQELPSLQTSHFISDPPVNQTISSLEVTKTSCYRTQPSNFISGTTVQSSIAYYPEPFDPPVLHQEQSYTAPTPQLPRYSTTFNQTPQTNWFPSQSRPEFGAFSTSSNEELDCQVAPASVIEPEIHNSIILSPPTLCQSMLHGSVTYGRDFFNPPMPKQEFSVHALQGSMHDHYFGITPMPQYLPQGCSDADGIQAGNRKEVRKLLRAWCDEHADNPHPTYAQKIHLAKLTGLSKVQIENTMVYLRRKIKLEAKRKQMISEFTAQSHILGNKAEKEDLGEPLFPPITHEEERMK